MSFKVDRDDDLAGLENAVDPLRLPGAADQPGRDRRPGRVHQVRHAQRPHHGAGPRGRARWAAAAAGQPAPVPVPPGPAAARGGRPPGSPRRGWTTCWSPPRRSARSTQFYTGVLGFRVTEQLLRRQRPPDRHLDGALAHAARPGRRVRAQRRPAPLRLLARRLGPGQVRRPTSSPTTASPSTSARPGTASPAARPSTSSTRSAPATRCSPAATGPTPTSRRSPGPRTTSGRAIFYYEGQLNDRFMKVHT